MLTCTGYAVNLVVVMRRTRMILALCEDEQVTGLAGDSGRKHHESRISFDAIQRHTPRCSPDGLNHQGRRQWVYGGAAALSRIRFRLASSYVHS